MRTGSFLSLPLVVIYYGVWSVFSFEAGDFSSGAESKQRLSKFLAFCVNINKNAKPAAKRQQNGQITECCLAT